MGISWWGIHTALGNRRLRRIVPVEGDDSGSGGGGGGAGGAGWASPCDSGGATGVHNAIEMDTICFIDLNVPINTDDNSDNDDGYEPVEFCTTTIDNNDQTAFSNVTVQRDNPIPMEDSQSPPHPTAILPFDIDHALTCITDNESNEAALQHNNNTPDVTQNPITYENLSSPGDVNTDMTMATSSPTQTADHLHKRMQAYYHLVEVDGSAYFEEPLDAWLNCDRNCSLPPHHEADLSGYSLHHLSDTLPPPSDYDDYDDHALNVLARSADSLPVLFEEIAEIGMSNPATPNNTPDFNQMRRMITEDTTENTGDQNVQDTQNTQKTDDTQLLMDASIVLGYTDSDSLPFQDVPLTPQFVDTQKPLPQTPPLTPLLPGVDDAIPIITPTIPLRSPTRKNADTKLKAPAQSPTLRRSARNKPPP